jgi:hypothetical protein
MTELLTEDFMLSLSEVELAAAERRRSPLTVL